MEFEHFSVLLQECIEGLSIRPEGIYVDGTAGGAGHSKEIARRLTTGRLIALDKDPDAVRTASERLSCYPGVQVVQTDFAEISAVLDRLGVGQVDGILLDLGVSSYQLDNAERGFSYHQDAPLDMRMSREGLSARDLVNTWSPEDMARIIREFGEEKYAWSIAKNIAKARAEAPVETTGQLADIIRSSMPFSARRDGNPAKKTFQAIRIAVNGELDALPPMLNAAAEHLNAGGRLAVISFHSLEDRIIKKTLQELATGCTCPPNFPVCVCGKTPKMKLISRKPITPGDGELTENPRARSAKLRVAEKL